MITIITKNLFVKPKVISLAKAIQIIEQDDPYVTTDWHIGKFVNKKQTEASYQKYKKETDDMIDLIKGSIKPKPYNPVLCLGDITEGEIDTPEYIRWLYEIVQHLPGHPRILIRGNNDVFDDNFYHKMGFNYVSDTFISSQKLNIIFSHEPVSIPESKLDPEVWINVHGHSHGTNTLYNMKPEDATCHLDVYHRLFNQGIRKLSWYLSMFRQHPERYKSDVIYKYGWS